MQLIDNKLKEIELAQRDQTELRRLVEMKKHEQVLGAKIVHLEEKLKLCKDQLKEGENQIKSLAQKLNESEKRLYSDGQTNTRELEHLQNKVTSLVNSKASLENELIKVMEAIESLETELATIKDEHLLLHAQCAEHEQSLKAHLQKLRSSQRRVQAQRDALLLTIPPELYKQYGTIYAAHEGIAVAKVKKGLCNACQVRLSPALLEKVRLATEPVHCEFCGRILFYPKQDENSDKRSN